MARPHGATKFQVPEKIIVAAPSFTDARHNLVSTLENLSFLKVVSVQQNARGYYGEAVELHFRDTRERPKLSFFDKFGRSRNSLQVGPIHLAQAPMGPDHVCSVPTVGEILVGSLVPNTRGGQNHLEFVLRGWSSDAQPLKELLRILKFGTKATEFEARSILIQPSCLLLQCPENIKKSRDDIYMTARIILWGNLRPLQILACIQEPEIYTLKKLATSEETAAVLNIKITTKASDYINMLIVKLHDTNLSEAFTDGLDIRAAKTVDNFGGYGVPQVFTGYDSYAAQNFTQAPTYPEVRQYSPRSPSSSRTNSPPYMPSSPVQAPISVPCVPAGSTTPTYNLYD